MHIENKTLFQLQAELIDTKVELAVNKAINQVVEQIMNLRHEVHKEMSGLKHEMHEMKQDMLERLSQVDNRLSSVETALGMRNEVHGEIRSHFLTYLFKAGWLLAAACLASMISYAMTHSYTLFQ